MTQPHKLISTLAAVCLACSCLAGCSGNSISDAAQTITGQIQPTHASSIEGTWCLEAGTTTGGDSLTFNSVKDERNMLVVTGDTATLTIAGVPHPLKVHVTSQDEASSSALLTDEGNTTVINASVFAAEGESRDSLLLASGYNDQVFLVGIREDAALPKEPVSIDESYWALFSNNA
ncbi:MAG: hypothetical protein IJI12_01660 [Atopobiaceae bacterium]|nr:hypothetical protein [Atopobiaceae bacterium]